MRIHLLLLILLLPFCTFADTKLEDVLALNTKATGGKQAIERIQSVEFLLTIQEPKFTVDAVYRADRNIRMRIDVFSEGKRVFTEAFDGRNGWQMGEDGKPKDASAEGTAALRNGIFLPGKLFGLHELSALGHKLTYEGLENIENTSYYVLKITLDSGFQKFLYVNADNGRIERTRDNRALHVDIDPTKKWTESKNSDFRNVDGVLYAFQSASSDLKTKEIVQSTTVKEIKINPVIDDSIYRRP